MKVVQITPRWANDFVRYLRREGGAKNSIALYIAMFRVFWRWCVKKRASQKGNPFDGIVIDNHKPIREYLTIEELQTLVNTPTKYRVREPFLFSCFTGLRWSDIQALRWGDVEEFGGRTRLRFTQQKTKAHEYMDLNAQAVALMGERKEDSTPIFDCTSRTMLLYRCASGWRVPASRSISPSIAPAIHSPRCCSLSTPIYTGEQVARSYGYIHHADIRQDCR